MQKQETMTQAHIRKAQGAFLLAHRMGLIEDPTMEGLETRRQKHNEELRRMEQEGQTGFLRTEQRSVRTLSWGLFYL